MHDKQQETTLTANGRGVQPYISRDIIRDTRCPLIPGETAVAELVPDVGVILRPAGSAEIDEVIVDV